MRAFLLVGAFAMLAIAGGGGHARGPATWPDAASDVCASAAGRFLSQCRTAQSRDFGVERYDNHVLLQRGAGLTRTGELSFFVRGITAADIHDRFSARPGETGVPVAVLLLGIWSVGLVALARRGW